MKAATASAAAGIMLAESDSLVRPLPACWTNWARPIGGACA